MFPKFFFAPDGAGSGGTPTGTPPANGGAGDPPAGGAPTGQPENNGQPKPPATWDEFLQGQPDEIKALYESHTTGLRNTVAATRQERDALNARLADITKALGKDPEEAKRLLEEMSSDLETATRRATFTEEAIRPEIGCANPKAAWLVAQAEGLFDSRGNPNWDAIKTSAPELFAKPRPAQANAGAGTGNPTPVTDMNAAIRRAAGRY